MIYSYYPGCSLHGSSKEYDKSTLAVCSKLGIELQELPDWICCGASSGHSLNPDLNIALPAQNLKIAEAAGHDIAVPCAACYNRLKTAEHALKQVPEVKDRMKSLMDYDFRHNVQILNLLELFAREVTPDQIRKSITLPLKGLKLASYYGCLLVRPSGITQFDDPEHPLSLDRLMETVEAEILPWSYKSECCGGSLSLTRDDIVTDLVDTIISLAKEAGADAIVTLCPLCLENLDMRQSGRDFPIFYFTELLGLAFGIEDSREWIGKHLSDPAPVLKSRGLIT